MLWRVAQLLYLMAPAYCANMAPPFVHLFPVWNRPLSERWLGSHKTVTGVLAGLSVAVITALIQWRIRWRGGLIDYDYWPAIGLLLVSGAMGGDLAKSFLKRRIGIAPGGRWIPADQLDFVAGALLLIAHRAGLTWWDIGITLAVSFFGDVAVNQLAFRLGIRDTAW